VKYGATVRIEKCEVGKSAVDFNGHRLSASGLQPLQSNVEAIERIPPAVNQSQLQRFVGAASAPVCGALYAVSAVAEG
jgi:hypothetical protein